MGFQNQNADWWTATTKDSEFVYRLFIGDGANTPQDSNYKDRGFSLRSNTARRYPLSYVYSGSYVSWETSEGIGGQVYEQGSYGDWWTTLAEDDTYANRFIIALNYAMLSNNARKIAFYPLRSTFARRYPLSYVFSGYYYWGGGYMGGQDSSGYWWSTAAGNGSNAYGLGMDSSNLNPQYNVNKADGWALRCVSHSMLYPSVSAFVCILRLLLLGRW